MTLSYIDHNSIGKRVAMPSTQIVVTQSLKQLAFLLANLFKAIIHVLCTWLGSTRGRAAALCTNLLNAWSSL